MTTTLAVCPVCQWPMVADSPSCLRCEQQVADNERTISGQMPSMSLFAETQQESSTVRRRSEIASRAANAPVAPERQRIFTATRMAVGLLVVLIAAFTATSLHHGDSQPSLAADTPVASLPWHTARSASGALTVDVPGPSKLATGADAIGRYERVSANVPGTSVMVTEYTAIYGGLSSATVAADLLRSRANELGNTTSAAGRAQFSLGQWGDVYDLRLPVDDGATARLRVAVVNGAYYIFEVVGPQTRVDEIFGMMIITWTP